MPSRRALAAAVLLTILLAARPDLGAEEPRATVVLVRPTSAPPTVTEALVHLRGELALAGFAARIVEVPVGTDVRASLERVSPASDVVAVVTVLPVAVPPAAAAPELAAAELWVMDRLTGKTVVRRTTAVADRQRAAEILSVRAVELLRASFVELAIIDRAHKPATASAPEAQAATRWASAALDEQQRAWSYGMELGGAVLTSPNGVGPALLPLIRLERAMGERLLVRASAAGLGAPARVTTAGGFADVTQSLLLVEGAWRFRAASRVQPLVMVGAGALRFSAEGHASPPAYVGAGGARWLPVADVGVGARFSIRRRFELGAELHALGAEPYPTVRFQEAEVARAGRPSIMASVTVLGGL